MKKAKIVISVILALIIVVTSFSVCVSASEDYSKKIVSKVDASCRRELIEQVYCQVKTETDKNGKEIKKYTYDISKTEPTIWIDYLDGTHINGSPDEIERETGVRPEFAPLEFTSENHAGMHQVTVTYRGLSAKMDVKIVKKELKGLTGNLNGSITEISDGEFIETSKGKVFKYDIEDKMLYRAEFDQFVTIEGTAKELEKALGEPVILNYDPEKNVFKPGDNYVTASLMGMECEIRIFLRENPINKISAEATVELKENVDGHWATYTDKNGKNVTYFHYDIFATDPHFTLKLKEGGQRVGDREGIESLWQYKMTEIDNQSSKPWSVGNNKAKILFMGHECTFDVKVVESNIKKVEISGKNNLTVKITSKDGKMVTHKAQDFVLESYDENNFYGFLITDKGVIENVMFTMDGDKTYVTIEGTKSNGLSNNNWLPAVVSADTLLYYSVAYSITDKSFIGVDAKNPSAHLDNIVNLALYLGAEPTLDEEHGVYYYHSADVKTTEKYIKEIFGVSGLDLTKAKGYNPETGTITVAREAAVSIVYQTLQMEYIDNQWVFQMAFSATDFDYMDQVEIVLNKDFTVASIRFMSKVGDVNGDGNITAIDARLVLRYVAGIVEKDKFEMLRADINCDGKITAVDARIILQYVAGLI